MPHVNPQNVVNCSLLPDCRTFNCSLQMRQISPPFYLEMLRACNLFLVKAVQEYSVAINDSYICRSTKDGTCLIFIYEQLIVLSRSPFKSVEADALGEAQALIESPLK